jgi:putative oxidoreductase
LRQKRLIDLSSYALSLLRVIAGFTFALYGAKLLFGAFGGADNAGHPAPLASLFGVGGVLEFAGGTLIAVGLFTRPSAFILSGQMAVAFFLEHFPHGWNPILNDGTTAVLYSFIFLYLAAAGGGPLAIERLFWRSGQPLET